MGQKKKNCHRMHNILIYNIIYILPINNVDFMFYSPEPKPVFHSNGHRKTLHKCSHLSQDVLSPQHEKLIHYINECKYSFQNIFIILKITEIQNVYKYCYFMQNKHFIFINKIHTAYL